MATGNIFVDLIVDDLTACVDKLNAAIEALNTGNIADGSIVRNISESQAKLVELEGLTRAGLNWYISHLGDQ